MASLFDYLEQTSNVSYIKFFIFNYMEKEKIKELNTIDFFDIFEMLTKAKYRKEIKDLSDEEVEKILNEVIDNIEIFKLEFKFRRDFFYMLIEDERRA